MNQGRYNYADTLLKEDVITVTIANLCMNQGRDVSRGERRVVGLVAQGERSGLPTQEGWNEDHTCSETFHYCGRVQYFPLLWLKRSSFVRMFSLIRTGFCGTWFILNSGFG
jgi:hypothetical protein